ncbi:endosomal/lysosomal proton channel TMEM175 isoform X1 [Denticeps clupeoides]|uniref:endosomal/lysosomal proton channel TMEM175 isoform X1 n=1 Tax=Denticeps clupeoides TaxID=299321 RepID=UPI0010A4D976|nr:endosomal/lysosomal potassium channel TMEM175 isoform X1 [Denticeps clupeoides]
MSKLFEIFCNGPHIKLVHSTWRPNLRSQFHCFAFRRQHVTFEATPTRPTRFRPAAQLTNRNRPAGADAGDGGHGGAGGRGDHRAPRRRGDGEEAAAAAPGGPRPVRPGGARQHAVVAPPAGLQRRAALHHRHRHDFARRAHQIPRRRGAEGEHPAAPDHQGRRLPDDLPHRHRGLGRAHQAVSGHRAHRRLPRPAQLGLHDDYNLPPVHSESSPHGITFSLMATFPDHIMGLLLFCGCVMVIGLIQSIIVVYGFSRPFLLNSQIQISENQAFYKRHILKVIMRVPVVCLFASIFSFVFFQLSYVILAVVVFLPYISQCLSWCRTKLFGRPAEEAPDSLLFYTYHPNEPLSKERVEAFSDGVYAIVATLLILDICEDNVPDPGTVQRQFNGSLTAALQVYGPEFLAYFGSFATVGLLWFVHHSLFLHVTKATRSMGLLNTFSLAFVGGLPLAYELTHEFPRNSHNELEAVQTSCVIIFFAGIFQLAIWVVALFSERETLHPYVRYGGPDHTFMLAKLSLYPCVALATFFLTCILSQFSAPIFHLMEITVPFAFLLLRLLVRVAMAVLRALFRPATAIEDDEDSRLPFNDLVT